MFLTTVYNTKHSLRVMEDVTLEGVGEPLTSYSRDNPSTVNHRVDIGLLPKAPPGNRQEETHIQTCHLIVQAKLPEETEKLLDANSQVYRTSKQVRPAARNHSTVVFMACIFF